MWYNGAMDNQEYLNQISAKPVKAKGGLGLGNLFGSKIAFFILVALVALVIMAILGVALGSKKGSPLNDTKRLSLHLDSTAKVISDYQPQVKSSVLRSNSASLASVIANTNGKLKSYLAEKTGDKDNDKNSNLEEQIKTEQDALLTELFEARINGYLDRVYAHKMAYEIERFMNQETKIYNSTSDTSLKEILDESYNSLENIYDSFNKFPEG